MRARPHSLHRLFHKAMRHEGHRSKGGTLCPCHVSLSSAPLCLLQKAIDVTAIEVYRSCLVPVLTFERDYPSGLPYREGQLYAQPQPLSTPGPASPIIYRCLDLWLLCRNVYLSSPWILRRPTFRPWKARKQKTLYDQHDRVLAPLSFPKQASSLKKARLKLLSFS